MKEYIPLLSFLGLLSGGLLAFGWAAVRGFRARDKRRLERAEQAEIKLSESQSQLIEVHRLEAAAWKTRYEGEHEEFTTYRKSVHEKAQMDGAKMLALVAENAELKSKTDLTPILQSQKDQQQINVSVLDQLTKLSEIQTKILKQLGGNGSA